MRSLLIASSILLCSATTPASADWEVYGGYAKGGSGLSGLTMAFKCVGGDVQFRVLHESFLGLHSSPVEVTISADDKPNKNLTLRVIADDDTQAYMRNSKSLAQYLMGSDLVTLWVTPEHRNKMYSLIGMDGSDYAIYNVFKTCGDPLAGPQPRMPSKARTPETKEEATDQLADDLKGLFGGEVDEKADPVAATIEYFQQLRVPKRYSNRDLVTYQKVTLVGDDGEIEVDWLEQSQSIGFDDNVSETLKRLFHIPAFDIAPTDQNGNKYFCFRATPKDAEIDFACEYTKPKKPINSRI